MGGFGKTRSLSKDQVKQMMYYDRDEFFKNHLVFDCPPPTFEQTSDPYWTMLAKAIVTNEGGLAKYIDYAKKWKLKEHEWRSLPFIKPYKTTKKSGKNKNQEANK